MTTINLIQVTTMSAAQAWFFLSVLPQGEFVVIAQGDRTPVNNGGRVSIVRLLWGPSRGYRKRVYISEFVTLSV